MTRNSLRQSMVWKHQEAWAPHTHRAAIGVDGHGSPESPDGLTCSQSLTRGLESIDRAYITADRLRLE